MTSYSILANRHIDFSETVQRCFHSCVKNLNLLLMMVLMFQRFINNVAIT